MITLFTTFTFASIEAWVIALMPALTAVGAICTALYKIVKSIKEMKSKYNSLEEAVNDKTELTAVKNEMLTVIQQNAVLRNEIQSLITETRKVRNNVPNDKEV